MIEITPHLAIDESEIVESFIHASGPGGQRVNKTSTAVMLRFDLRGSPSLPDAVRARAERLAGSRLTLEGVIVIQAQSHRSREANRRDALERLVELLARAAIAPVRRRPTRPTLGSKKRRLESKFHRSGVKKNRSDTNFD